MAGEGGVMPVYPSEKAQKTSSVENEWVKVRLGDCLIDHKHKKGKKPKHLSQKYSEGVLPYATAEYFRTCKAVDFVPVDYLDSCVHIKKDDLIIILSFGTVQTRERFLLGERSLF